MHANSLTPDLMVEDVQATVDWYERVFDAEVAATLPSDADANYFWAQVMIDDSPLMIQDRESLERKLPVLEGAPVGGSVALYVDVDDAKALYDDLEAADVEIVNSPHETEFGWRQFAVTDCNGYVLWFGEKLETERTEDIGRQRRIYHEHLTDEGAGRQGDTRGPPPANDSEHWG